MKNLFIQAGSSHFGISVDYYAGRIEISGNSYPENPIEFFSPVLEYLKTYLNYRKKSVSLILKINYFNTTSSRYLFKMLQLLAGFRQRGYPLQIIYHHRPGNDDMLESWQEFMQELSLDFEIVND